MGEPHQRTVVIIEDDVDLRGLVATVLSNAGYRVDATGDSQHAVDLVRQDQPDLVLCDIAMPGMDGYAVVRALQSDPDTRRFPVVFLTARREFTDRVRAFRFGVVDYITKPVSADTLLSRIEAILGRAGASEGDPSILLVDASKDVPAAAAAPEDLPPAADSLPLPDFSEVPTPLREIVIADDDPSFRKTLAGVFARCGFRVREAGDGMEAIRRVLEKPPSILLVDVRMPVLDGLDVCRRLRSCALTRHLPIVFLSGFDELGARAAGLEAGGNEFLSKLGSLRELLLRVQLQLQRYNGPAIGGDGEVALRGRIEFLGAPGVLQICVLTALTGTLTATEGGEIISMGFEDGRLLSADSGAAQGREAVFEFVTWDHGTFTFAGGRPYDGTAIVEPATALVLEGCRRIDARNRELSPAGASARA